MFNKSKITKSSHKKSTLSPFLLIQNVSAQSFKMRDISELTFKNKPPYIYTFYSSVSTKWGEILFEGKLHTYHVRQFLSSIIEYLEAFLEPPTCPKIGRNLGTFPKNAPSGNHFLHYTRAIFMTILELSFALFCRENYILTGATWR